MHMLSTLAANNDAERERCRKRREDVAVGAVDGLGYVVCNACVWNGRACTPLRPIAYGATYSAGPCDKCGKRVDGEAAR